MIPRTISAITVSGLILSGIAGTALIARQPQQPPAQNQPADQEPTIRVNVELVNVYFNVKVKKGGQLIPSLTKDDFRVFEDGKEQTIQRFSRETDLPLTLGLLIDISASQERLIDIERQAAASFFSSVIRPKDEAFLISFGKDTELLQDFTNSPRQLTSAMTDLRGDGQIPGVGGPLSIPNSGPVPTSGTPKGTLLFDAVYLASTEKLKSEVGRKALILITDGEDQGSTNTWRTAIEAAQKSDAIIYSIYYVDRGFYAAGGMIFGGGGEGDLRHMSSETGGHVFTVDRKHPLNEIFRQIQEELRNQYSIGYQSTNPVRDGKFRRLEIKTQNSEYQVQARNGYYATPIDVQ